MASKVSSGGIDINKPSQEDIAMMLACSVHTGSRNVDPAMKRYIWKRRADGVYLFNLQKTYEKIVLAARMIVAQDQKKDTCVISARPWGQRASLKFSQHTGAHAIAGRFTPGTFTNYIQAAYQEPRLLIVTDPRTDGQALREGSYVNIPTIAICHSDSPVKYVDCVIPANNKGKHSLGLIYWLLTREVLRLRAEISRSVVWDVMVDLYFYRDPEEVEKEEETAGENFGDAAASFAKGFYDDAAGVTDGAAPPAGGAPIDWSAGAADWDATQATGEWGADSGAPPSSAPPSSAPPSGGAWDGLTEWGDSGAAADSTAASAAPPS